jgi:hypothetical protein
MLHRPFPNKLAYLPAFVTIAATIILVTGLSATTAAAASLVQSSTPIDKITFNLKPNPKFLSCMAQNPGDPSHQPTAIVTVTRGHLADSLLLTLANFKPHLAFSLFTVQRTNLQSNGQANPAFKNFGLAWYQSDMRVNARGTAAVRITLKSIFLDQIFGFDPAARLNPVRTLHVGFWFDDPADAAACGFTGATPFNGEHHAGPNAMISVPNAQTKLGPLCTNPNTSTHPATCNP